MSGQAAETRGEFDAGGLRVAIAASRFHEDLVDRLLRGALEELAAAGVAAERTTIVRVPGSFELPLAAAALARSGRHDAVICLGVLVRGETAHFDLIGSAVAHGLTRVSLDAGLPVAFGVVTAENLGQAEARAGGEEGNRGADAARAALAMAALRPRLAGEA